LLNHDAAGLRGLYTSVPAERAGTDVAFFASRRSHCRAELVPSAMSLDDAAGSRR